VVWYPRSAGSVTSMLMAENPERNADPNGNEKERVPEKKTRTQKEKNAETAECKKNVKIGVKGAGIREREKRDANEREK